MVHEPCIKCARSDSCLCPNNCGSEYADKNKNSPMHYEDALRNRDTMHVANYFSFIDRHKFRVVKE